MHALGQFTHLNTLQLEANRRQVCIAQDLLRQSVQFWWFGRRNLYHLHQQGLRVVDEVDMVVESLDNECTFWPDAKFMCYLGQRRAVGWVNKLALGIHARFWQRQHLDRGDLREQRFAFRARDGDDGVLLLRVVQDDKIGAAVGLAAEQQHANGIFRHWPAVGLHADAAIWQRDQVLY